MTGNPSPRPYTYVTVTVDQQATRFGVAFHTPGLWVWASVMEEERPVLHLSTSEANVSISTTGGGPVTPGDVDLARELFNAAARYLADCEGLHTPESATSADPLTDTSPGTAADQVA